MSIIFIKCVYLKFILSTHEISVLIEKIKGLFGHVLLVGCLPPQNILHGDYNKKDEFFSVGQKVSYSCNPGYTLIGTNLVECTSLGTWSNTVPTCEGA